MERREACLPALSLGEGVMTTKNISVCVIISAKRIKYIRKKIHAKVL